MDQILNYFKPFPATTRYGLLCLAAAWLCFIFSLYHFFGPGQDWSRIIIIGAAMGCVVVSGYAWGRILCLISNIMIVLYCIFFSLIFFDRNPVAFAASIVVLVLFAGATYFFWTKESATFFKTFRKSASGSHPD